jgi:hypothetical protein
MQPINLSRAIDPTLQALLVFQHILNQYPLQMLFSGTEYGTTTA